MEVNEKVKQQFHSDSINKMLQIVFPDMDYTVLNRNILEESMQLKESILEKQNIEFVGCISSMFSIQLQEVYKDIKGQRIKVSICTNDTEDEPIPLFNGIVDSAVMQSNKRSKKVTAYDLLYTKGNTEVSGWYNSLSFPITLKALRDSLFLFLGMVQEEKQLPNDAVQIEKKYDPKSLKALNVIKAVCQINGAFGIMNRQGKFEYRILADLIDTGFYPSVMTFPGAELFPGSQDSEIMEPQSFGFYKKVDYEEYEVKPVDKLTIKQNENEAGVSFGTGTNNYIIQGNMFTLGKSSEELLDIAENIYWNVKGIYYHPFESENNGLPWVECGLDAISFYMKDFIPEETATYKTGESARVRNFYVFSRELTGIQALRDNYSAKGEEYQTEFITDLQTQIDTIKQNTGSMKDWVEDYTYDKETINDMFESTGGAGDFKVISTKSVPSSYLSNALYLVQGEVFVQ